MKSSNNLQYGAIMDLTEYYKGFLNHEMSRDFLSIGDYPMEIKSNFPQVIMRKLLNERAKFQNKLFYSISIKRDGQRLSDRLFFDFDLENEKYKALTTSESARDMLLNSDILEKPFNEMAMSYDYLKEMGFNPYPVATNSKGYHLYIFFNPILIENIGYISTNFAEKMQQDLNLSTIDLSVNKDAHMRKARLPYSRHNKTDLFVTPCDVNDDISDILSDAVNPTVRDFHMDSYIADGFSEILSEMDKDVSTFLKLERERKEMEREKERQSQKDVIIHKDVDLSSIDMRELVRSVASEYYVKSQSNYDIYNCPFHDDNHHSCGCYEKRFHCSACGKSWNYYEFISEYFGLTEKDDIINEVKKHI